MNSRRRKRRRVAAVCGLAVVLSVSGGATGAGVAALTSGSAAPGGLHRVSVDSRERQVSGSAPRFLQISAHGRYVVYSSPAADLVPGDTNGVQDVFVRDRARGTTSRVSVSSSGAQANDGSSEPAISADGRYVAFTSGASNLVAGDTNGRAEVFVRDLRAGTTRRVAAGTGGRQPDSETYFPSISADGRFVAFQSAATNLVRGDTNGVEDVFVRDLRTGGTSRVSVPAGGGQFRGPSATPSISASGRYVAFISNPHHPDRFEVFLRDRRSGTTREVTVGYGGQRINGATGQIAISGDGRRVAYISDATNIVRGDTNGDWDTFVYDVPTRTTRRVSVSSTGRQDDEFSDMATLSYNGRYVAFASEAPLVAGDTNRHRDVFVRDLTTGITRRVSTGPGGVQGDDDSGPDYAPQVALSADGRHAAFVSAATNLVARDTNAAADVFAWDAP